MGMITKAEREIRMGLYEQGLKKCSSCAGNLPLGRFRPNTESWMGLRSRCVDCDNAAKMEYQRRTPERQAARQKRWREANLHRSHEIAKEYRDSHPIEERLRSGRIRAEQAGLPADDITAAELLADWERRGIDPEE